METKQTSVRIKTTAYGGPRRNAIEKISKLLQTEYAPDLVLNRHCGECEFQARCRQKAMEIDDLSLFSGMKPEERERHRRKGIFTINQLSYTFRQRRQPRRAEARLKNHTILPCRHSPSVRTRSISMGAHNYLPLRHLSTWTLKGCPLLVLIIYWEL